jgi:gas vesicle protein
MSKCTPRNSKKTCHTGSLVTGLLIGAAIGATAGLLLAPRSGAETIAQLKGKTQASKGQADKILSEGTTQAKVQSSDIVAKVQAKIALLIQAFVAGKQAAFQKHQQLNNAELYSEVSHG